MSKDDFESMKQDMVREMREMKMSMADATRTQTEVL
jgi:hypothetical protein